MTPIIRRAWSSWKLTPVRSSFSQSLRIAELVARYHTLPLGRVDASVIATAERLGVTEIATLDHRHFGVVRPNHTRALSLLP